MSSKAPRLQAATCDAVLFPVKGRRLRPALYSPLSLGTDSVPRHVAPAANRARVAVSPHSCDDRWRFRPPGGDAAATAVVACLMSTGTMPAAPPD